MSLKLSLTFSSMATLLAFVEHNNIESIVAKENYTAANSQIPADLPLAAVLAGRYTPQEAEGSLDADGLPWDERIHSSNKKFKADGRWTKRKNVDETTYNGVLGELRSRFPQTAVNQIPAPAIPNYTVAPQPLPPIGNFLPQPLPSIEPTAYIPPVMPQYAAPAQGAGDMGHLFQRIQQIFAVGDATVNSQYVTSVINRLSQMFNVAINSINDIGNRPDIIQQAHNLLNQDGKQ